MAKKTEVINDPASKNTRKRTLVDANTAIADYGITWTSNEPTAGDTATIADGTVPTVAELGQAVADLTAKLNFVLAAQRDHGNVAS